MFAAVIVGAGKYQNNHDSNARGKAQRKFWLYVTVECKCSDQEYSSKSNKQATCITCKHNMAVSVFWDSFLRVSL